MPTRYLLLLAALALLALREVPQLAAPPQVVSGGEPAAGGEVLSVAASTGGMDASAPLTGRASAIDGDSLRLAGEEIRLHGIDAPEAAQRCRDAEGRAYACGREASGALARLVAAGRTTCKGSGRDRYGRLLAVCESGGSELNEAMVESGWALAFRRYADAYVPAEARARAARRGLWAGRFIEPWDWRDGRRLANAARARPGKSASCRIKGNISESGRIYHVPGSPHYDRTRIDPARGERWFCSVEDARRAGWRAPRG